MSYTPPSPADLQQLKVRLGLTGEQMADLAQLAGGQQWRKYTGGAEPRAAGIHMLFFLAARLALDADELRRVVDEMRALGADVDDIEPAPRA